MSQETQVPIIMRLLLLKLISMKKWGGAHTALRNITRGLPSRYTSITKGRKLFKKAIKELVNRRLITMKISTKETHVSLNSAESEEINKFLEEVENQIK